MEDFSLFSLGFSFKIAATKYISTLNFPFTKEKYIDDIYEIDMNQRTFYRFHIYNAIFLRYYRLYEPKFYNLIRKKTSYIAAYMFASTLMDSYLKFSIKEQRPYLVNKLKAISDTVYSPSFNFEKTTPILERVYGADLIQKELEFLREF